MLFEQVFEPIHAGNLTLRLAENEADVHAAQRLRYRIFCEEMGAVANLAVQQQKRDFDMFDEACYHLIVVDNNRVGDARVVGTYRLLTRTNMPLVGSFYTETEYDISAAKASSLELMELGRSCVEQQYRTRPVIQMLWQGIGAFIVAKKIGLMFGCASFHGVNVKEHIHALSYLYHYHLAPAEIRPKALPAHYVDMNLMPKEAVVPRAAISVLPPLIKGYLRLNGMVGDGAVLDYAFNTCDVSIIVQTASMQERYVQRYLPE
ncbi:MAG: GNAT family N-acyltransferase [Alphaproteobacteria bacterium]|nr:GNAT family N-acyltransferase [Alphaproteobacteria bacterium]